MDNNLNIPPDFLPKNLNKPAPSGNRNNKPHRTNFVVLFFVILAAGGIGAYYFLAQKSPGTDLINNNPGTKSADKTLPPQEDLNHIKNTLLPEAKLAFPAMSSSSKISKDQLPSQLLSLLANGYTQDSYSKATFANGKKGYLINYLVETKMPDVYLVQYNQFKQSKEWQLKSSMRSQTFGLIELENSTYQAHIEHTWTKDGDSQAEVSVLQK